MGLIADIKEELPIVSVHTFFFDEQYYPNIRLRSGDWGVGSPRIDATGVKGSGGNNHNENERLNIVHYRQAARAVEYAIAGCKERSQQILQYEYKDQRPIVECRALINLYGHDTYHNADVKACFEFSRAINTARILFCVTDLIPKILEQE